MSLCFLIYKMNIRKTPKQAYCEKETGSLCKACDLLVGAQSQQNPGHTHGHTHFFPYKVLRASQLLGVPSQSGQIWEVWKAWEDLSIFLSFLDSGERAEEPGEKHSCRHRGRVSGQECVVPGWYLSATSSCISHIATSSAKQKSPRCKWHRSIIWRRGDSKMKVLIIS